MARTHKQLPEKQCKQPECRAPRRAGNPCENQKLGAGQRGRQPNDRDEGCLSSGSRQGGLLRVQKPAVDDHIAGIALNNLTISANGYAFSGAAAYLISGAILSVADGKNVTFNNLMTGPNNAINWRLGAAGAPATMALLGNFTVGQFAVGSTNGSTLWLGGPGTSSGGVFTINANVTIQ